MQCVCKKTIAKNDRKKLIEGVSGDTYDRTTSGRLFWPSIVFSGTIAIGFREAVSRAQKGTLTRAEHSAITVEHYTPPLIVELARELMGGIDLDPFSCAKANGVVKASSYYDERSDGFAKPWSGSVFMNPPGGQLSFSKTDRDAGLVTDLAEKRLTWIRGRYKTKSFAAAAFARAAEHWAAGKVRRAFVVGFSLDVLVTTQGGPFRSLPEFPFIVCRDRIRFLSGVREQFEFENAKPRPNGARLAKLSALDPESLIEEPQPTHSNVLAYLPCQENGDEVERFFELFGELGVACNRDWRGFR